MRQTNVLFVCLGNICRSPTAHGVFQHLVNKEKFSDRIFVDSAGTGGWHIGKAPDRRSQVAAAKRGYDLSCLRARQFSSDDFHNFDYILAMDSQNLSDIASLKPAHYAGHLGLFLDFLSDDDYEEVPDPYYGDGQGFEVVLDLVEDASERLLKHIQTKK